MAVLCAQDAAHDSSQCRIGETTPMELEPANLDNPQRSATKMNVVIDGMREFMASRRAGAVN